MRDDLDKHMAFCLEEGHDYTAPLWLGEFGTEVDDDWWKFIIRYLSERPQIGFGYWAYDGYKYTTDEETYPKGIVNKDYKTVKSQWKLDALQSLLDGHTINDNQFLN